jgi:hypothetical protein
VTSPRTPSWQSASWISAAAAPATCVCGMSRSTICQCPEGIRAANFSSVVCDLLSRVVEDGAKRRLQTTRPPEAALEFHIEVNPPEPRHVTLSRDGWPSPELSAWGLLRALTQYRNASRLKTPR